MLYSNIKESQLGALSYMSDKVKQDILDELVNNMRRNCKDLKPNTWEWVESIRAELKTDTDNYPWRSASENLWEHVTDIQNDEFLNIERADRRGENPLEYLDEALEIPRYPPVEVLATISEAFQIYLAARGSLSLEDVFFGPVKKGVGNYSARKARNKIYLDFQMFLQIKNVSCFRRDLPKLSIEEVAIDYINGGIEALFIDKTDEENEYVDPDSFLRGFRRWKKANEDVFRKDGSDK